MGEGIALSDLRNAELWWSSHETIGALMYADSLTAQTRIKRIVELVLNPDAPLGVTRSSTA